MRHIRASIPVDAPPHRVWAPDGAGSIARQEVILASRAPGPLGWLHERLFGVIARRGIEAALRAAKATLESERAPS